MGRPAVAEWLDDDGLIAASSERPRDRAVAESGAKDTGDQHHRLAGTQSGDAQGLTRGDLDVADGRAVDWGSQEDQSEQEHKDLGWRL